MNFVFFHFFHLWMNFTMWLFSLFFTLLFMKIRAYFGTFIRAVHYYHSLLHMYGRVSTICIPPCNVLYMQNRQTWLIQNVPMNFLLLIYFLHKYDFKLLYLDILAEKSCVMNVFNFLNFLLKTVDFEIVVMEKWNFNTWLLMIDFIW